MSIKVPELNVFDNIFPHGCRMCMTIEMEEINCKSTAFSLCVFRSFELCVKKLENSRLLESFGNLYEKIKTITLSKFRIAAFSSMYILAINFLRKFIIPLSHIRH